MKPIQFNFQRTTRPQQLLNFSRKEDKVISSNEAKQGFQIKIGKKALNRKWLFKREAVAFG